MSHVLKLFLTLELGYLHKKGNKTKCENQNCKIKKKKA